MKGIPKRSAQRCVSGSSNYQNYRIPLQRASRARTTQAHPSACPGPKRKSRTESSWWLFNAYWSSRGKQRRTWPGLAKLYNVCTYPGSRMRDFSSVHPSIHPLQSNPIPISSNPRAVATDRRGVYNVPPFPTSQFGTLCRPRANS